MLSYLDYQNKWTSPAPVGFGRMLRDMPSYHEYVIREIYQQDYLDLFLGAITFNRTPLNGGIYYVQITGDLILDKLGIPLDPLYTFSLNGNDYIMVDYKYPWSMAQINQKRCIKYIMIGEAAPQFLRNFSSYNNDDPLNSYFYNKLHTNPRTSWLSAPIAAFSPSPNGTVLAGPSKLQKLLYLANNGYILFDLFPFAFSYTTTFRTFLNTSGMSSYFFINEVITKINDVNTAGLLCRTVNIENSSKVIMAFSGPPKIHHFLADEIASGRIRLPSYIDCRSYMNNTIPATLSSSPKKWKNTWISGNNLWGTKVQLNSVPFYRCCTCQNAQAGPSQLFIKIAFDL
jgi:hypothetical protein